MGNNQNPPQPSLIREGATLSSQTHNRGDNAILRFAQNDSAPVFVIADSEADPQSHNISNTNQPSPHPSPIGEGVKCVECTPHPVLRTTFSHTGEKVEIRSSRFTLHTSLKKKAAFTLAEVLITLGIIGVVAAMTIPGLIADYQRKVLVSQFKKSYSNLSNALNLVQAEYGTVYECYNTGFGGYHTDECKPFFDSYLKKINIIKECSDWRNKCHPTYKNKSEVLSAGGEVNNNACSFDIDSYTTYYSLADGSMFALQNNANTINHHQVFSLVDVNGMKGPNKWGYDLYMLTFQRNNDGQNVILSNSVCAMKEKGGMFLKDVLGE